MTAASCLPAAPCTAAMSAELELEWLCEVVARHAPAFFLHPADRYMPCTAEYFMRHSELRQAAPSTSDGGSSSVLLPRGCIAAPGLLEAQRAAPPGARLQLNLDPAARCGMPLVGGRGASQAT